MMSAAARGRRQAGFTLLELLVGLVVLGFILAGLSQGVRYGLRAGETQARLADSRGELDAVDRALRRLITQADPGSTHSGPTLQGTSGRMSLVSDLPDAATGSVAEEADIAIGVEAGRRLVLRWTPHVPGIRLGPAPAPQEVELLRDVEGLNLAYWKDGWQDSWQGQTLPALVRVRVLFPPGDPRHWPDIVAAPLRQRLG